MRRNARLSIYSKEDRAILSTLYEKYLKKGINVEFSSVPVVVNFYFDTSESDFFKGEMNALGLKYGYVELREYSKYDLENARYFIVNLPYPYEHDPEMNSDYFGTKYDNTREYLDTRKQLSYLQLDVKKFLKYPIAAIIPEVLVSEKTKVAFEANRFSGVSFGNVIDYKDRDLDKIYQLVVHNELPPMNLVDLKTEWPSKENVTYYEMGTAGYYGLTCIYPRTAFVFHEKDFNMGYDFYLTKEWFWGGNYRSQTMIVSKQVYDWFKVSKIRIRMEPVRLI